MTDTWTTGRTDGRTDYMTYISAQAADKNKDPSALESLEETVLLQCRFGFPEFL